MLTKIEAKLHWRKFCEYMRNYDQKGYESTVGIDSFEVKLDDGLTIQIVDFAGQVRLQLQSYKGTTKLRRSKCKSYKKRNVETMAG